MIVHLMAFGHTACMKDGPPGRWPEGHSWSNDWKDVTCPDCLKGKELFETFVIAPDGKSITCKRCGRTSWHQGDIDNHYCAYCQVMHDDIWPPARRWWVDHPEPHIIPINCACGYRLGIKRNDIEEVASGTWGTIPCPKCRARLNEKIVEAVEALKKVGS